MYAKYEVEYSTEVYCSITQQINCIPCCDIIYENRRVSSVIGDQVLHVENVTPAPSQLTPGSFHAV
jgi:hypothetical protein